MRLVDELNVLHDSYVTAVNAAVAQNDVARAEQLAQAYDDEAIRLIAEREGKTHLRRSPGRVASRRRCAAWSPASGRRAPPESQADTAPALTIAAYTPALGLAVRTKVVRSTSCSPYWKS